MYKELQSSTQQRREEPEDLVDVFKRQLSAFKEFTIDRRDLSFQRSIGSGGYAEVFLGYQKSNNKVVAIKRLHNVPQTQEQFEVFRREVDICSKLHHFAILPFVGVCIEPPYCIVNEFMSGRNLYERLHGRGVLLDGTKLTIIALGIACGMEYLHVQEMIHRDLKSLNVLLDADDFPKVCDFGVSRYLDQNGELMTGSIGTPQWMAPEVLNSEMYDESADVYSYGIILWEMLTRNAPFAGWQPMQVILRVVGGDARPIIPQNCPTNLAKVIRNCWQREAKLRPSFATIKDDFLKGAVAYPGTNPAGVESYIDQFITVRDKTQRFTEKPSKQTARAITMELSDETTQEAAVAKLKAVIKIPDRIPYLCNQDCLEVIVATIKDCSKSELASDLIFVIHALLQDANGLQKLLSREIVDGPDAILQLIWRFATTAMGSIIDCLQILLDHHALTFSCDRLTKLAPFFVANDLRLRVAATNLILSAIQGNAFDDPTSLAVLAANVLTNAIPEALDELLRATLALLRKLVDVPTVLLSIVSANGAELIFAVTSRKDKSFQLQALDILRKVLLMSCPTHDTIKSILAGFLAIVESRDADLQVHVMVILAILLRGTVVFALVPTVPSVFKSFQILFTSTNETVLTCALRLCDAFLSHVDSSASFVELRPNLVPLLAAQSEAAIQMAANCIAAIAQRAPAEVKPEDSLTQFLQQSLGGSSVLTVIAALKLAGVLSGSASGAQYLEGIGSISAIAKLLVHPTKKVKKLAFAVMASVSASLPISKAAIEAMPAIFASLDEEFENFPLIAISNFMVNPIAATRCAKRLSPLVKQFKSNDHVKMRLALTAIHRILLAPEAREGMTDSKTVRKLVRATEPYWDQQNAAKIFEIIERVAEVPACRPVVMASNLPRFLADRAQTMDMADPRRPVWLRILCRVEDQ
jgi:serine/threonine protein kinase